MQFPVHFGYGGFSISAHFVFETLAFIIGFRYFLYLRKKVEDPISEVNRIWILIAAAAGALIFSRLLGSLESPEEWFDSPHPLLHFYASKTIVGGLLGGLFSVGVMKYYLGVRTSSGDLFTYPIILAMMIGRIGCFSSGVYEPTYGIPSALPWALDLGDGLKRHPVALYEIVFLLLLWITLVQIEKRVLFADGIRFKLFMISYLLFRFLLEFIKPVTPVLLTFTSIQIACLAGLVYYHQTFFNIFLYPKRLYQHER